MALSRWQHGAASSQEDASALCAKQLVPVRPCWPLCVCDPTPDPNTDQSQAPRIMDRRGVRKWCRSQPRPW